VDMISAYVSLDLFGFLKDLENPDM